MIKTLKIRSSVNRINDSYSYSSPIQATPYERKQCLNEHSFFPYMGHLPGKQHLLYFKSRILNLLPLILLELILTFADEYQVQMFSGPFLEGSSDVEQCYDRNDIVCISYPGDFYEQQIPKRSLTAKKFVELSILWLLKLKMNFRSKCFNPS